MIDDLILKAEKTGVVMKEFLLQYTSRPAGFDLPVHVFAKKLPYDDWVSWYSLFPIRLLPIL
jgi:hypothetical protein